MVLQLSPLPELPPMLVVCWKGALYKSVKSHPIVKQPIIVIRTIVSCEQYPIQLGFVPIAIAVVAFMPVIARCSTQSASTLTKDPVL